VQEQCHPGHTPARFDIVAHVETRQFGQESHQVATRPSA
jgi:hypothetical protein